MLSEMGYNVIKDEVGLYYNSKEYIKDAASFARNDYAKRIKLIDRFIDLKSVGNIVELGCGAGVLQNIHKKYIGVDISERAINGLKNSICCDIGRRIELDTRSIDAIVSFNTLEHIPTPERTFQECARILKPGGLLLFQDAFNVRRGTRPYHIFKVISLRILSFCAYLLLNKRKFVYFKMQPDYTKIGEDHDACSQIDPYSIYLWFKKRGFTCLNNKNSITGLLWRDKFIILKKNEKTKSFHHYTSS